MTKAERDEALKLFSNSMERTQRTLRTLRMNRRTIGLTALSVDCAKSSFDSTI